MTTGIIVYVVAILAMVSVSVVFRYTRRALLPINLFSAVILVGMLVGGFSGIVVGFNIAEQTSLSRGIKEILVLALAISPVGVGAVSTYLLVRKYANRRRRSRY